MKSIITKSDSSQPVADTAGHLFDDWFDPIETAVRDRVRGFIQAMIEANWTRSCSDHGTDAGQRHRAAPMMTGLASSGIGTAIDHGR